MIGLTTLVNGDLVFINVAKIRQIRAISDNHTCIMYNLDDKLYVKESLPVVMELVNRTGIPVVLPEQEQTEQEQTEQ